MFEQYKEKKQQLDYQKQDIMSEIKKVIFKHQGFEFSAWKPQPCLSRKYTVDDITDTESEEYMMRFFGMYEEESKYLKWIKLLALIGIAYYAYFNWNAVADQLQNAILQFPFINDIVTYIQFNLNSGEIWGLFLVTFFASLPIMDLPEEVFVIAYLFSGHNPLIVAIVYTAGTIAGLALSYLAGKLIGSYVLKKMLKKKFYEYKFNSDKYGSFVLILGNIIPAPIQLLTVVMGAFNYGIVKMMFYSAIGKLLKSATIFYGFSYYTQSVSPVLNSTMECVKTAITQSNTSLPFIKP